MSLVTNPNAEIVAPAGSELRSGHRAVSDGDSVTFGRATIEALQLHVAALKGLQRPEEIAARRGLPLEDVAPAALLRARAGVGA